MTLSLYLDTVETDSEGFRIPRLSAGATRKGFVRFSQDVGLIYADTSAAQAAQIAGDALCLIAQGDTQRDFDSATPNLAAVAAFLTSNGFPTDLLQRLPTITSRQIARHLTGMFLIPKRIQSLTGEPFIEAMKRSAPGLTDAARISNALAMPAAVLRDILNPAWSDIRYRSRFPGSANVADVLLGASDLVKDPVIAGLSLDVPLAAGFTRQFAYGENRTQLASDAFPSSIDGNWTNPPTGMNGFTWNASGDIRVTTGSVNSIIVRTGETYAADHYAVMTCANQGNSTIMGAAARWVDDDGYAGTSSTFGSQQRLFEFANGTGTEIAADDDPSTNLAAGNTVTIEAEGTTIRQGRNSGADGEQLSVTDATYSGGDPGIFGFNSSTGSNLRISAASMGDISSSGLSIMLAFNHYRNMHNA